MEGPPWVLTVCPHAAHRARPLGCWWQKPALWHGNDIHRETFGNKGTWNSTGDIKKCPMALGPQQMSKQQKVCFSSVQSKKLQGSRDRILQNPPSSSVHLFCLRRMILLIKAKDETGDWRLQQSEQTSGDQAAWGVSGSGMLQLHRTQPSSDLLCPARFRIFRSSRSSSGVRRGIGKSTCSCRRN